MTAIIVAAQRSHGRIHVATDAAIYRPDQTVVAFGTKTYPVPHWPGVVTTAGNAAMTPLLGWRLAQDFRTFDEAVAGIENVLTVLVSMYELPSGAEVFIAGISAVRGPEAYVLRTTDEPPKINSIEEARASEFWAESTYQLVKLPDVVMTPVPEDQIIAAHYEGVDLDGDTDAVIWSLRKLLEMQRQMKLPDGVGGIGGWGQCVTVSAEGITSQMLQRWPDHLGAPLRPEPIDWDRWHAENPKPGESRLRRDIEARKAQKRLRVV